MKLGINTNCDCGDTLREELLNIKAAGFRHIMYDEKSGDLESGLRLAREIGLDVAYVHLAYRAPFGPDANELWVGGVVSKTAANFLIGQIKTCAKFGVKVAVMHATRLHEDALIKDLDFAAGLSSIKQIVSEAENLGVKIACENMMQKNDVCLRHLLDNIDSKNFGLCYDCGHDNLYRPSDLLQKYGDRVFAIHIQDNLMDAAHSDDWDRDIHLLPGDGKIDFNSVCRDIAVTNYDGVFMLELHRDLKIGVTSYDMPPLEFLREAKRRGERLAGMLVHK